MIAKILLVDDEVDLLAELRPFLERSDYGVITAKNGVEALAKIEMDKPDLVVLDLMMPQMDGRETLRRLRSANNWIPVILLTVVDTQLDRIGSFNEGADDYLNKPYDPMELLARIQAILRRSQRPHEPSHADARQLVSAALTLDRQTRIVSLNDNPIHLGQKAFNLLAYLMTEAPNPLSREHLLEKIWGYDLAAEIQTRAVDVRIREIRRQLNDNPDEPQFIETVIGVGYRFMQAVEVVA